MSGGFVQSDSLQSHGLEEDYCFIILKTNCLNHLNNTFIETCKDYDWDYAYEKLLKQELFDDKKLFIPMIKVCNTRLVVAKAGLDLRAV